MCKHTLKDKNNFIKNINQLVRIAPDNHADWGNEDWGDLIYILDRAEHYPFFVDASLVSKEFIKRMNVFEKEVQREGMQYCENILKRYSDPNIIKLANKTQEPI